MQISEYVFIDEINTCVKFAGGEWVKVADLEEWYLDFLTITLEDRTGRDAYEIEKDAFDSLTSKP